MRSIKSERLKKLESELADLQQWLNLGLVPKKDVKKHEAEIKALEEKIEEELERLQFLKESGDLEEYITPKRGNQRTAYTDLPSLPDMDASDTQGGGQNESGFDMATDTPDNSNSIISEQDDTEATETQMSSKSKASDDDMEDEESFFSNRSRWRRDGIMDPDADDW